MKTQWVNDITGTYYDDYDEAREAVLKFMGYTDTLKNTLIEYINNHGESKVLNGLAIPEFGQQICEEVFQMAEEHFLSDYLVEIETEDEEDENV
jgi:hypothetical protein